MNATIWRLDAAGAADGAAPSPVSLAPASFLVRADFPDPNSLPAWGCTLITVGHPAEIDRHPANAEVHPHRRRSLPTSVIIPALVNAHAHLDLTHIGPRPFDPGTGFVGWAMSLVRANRATTLDAALASLRRGIALSLAGGVVAVGDILGALPPNTHQLEDPRAILNRELTAAFGPMGIGFAEVFGVGASQTRAAAELDRLAKSGCSLQPHAPYSAGRSVYRHAARLCAESNPPPRLSTHLAETLDERRFIMEGQGPFREPLERIGVWDHHAAAEVGHGAHPIEHALGSLGTLVPLLAAHVNDCPSPLIPRLRDAQVSVAYCPRAHEYFLHPHTTGPHRYRDMLEAGVNVCLGTDSIINLPADQSNRISPLDDMRLLFQRDRTDPATLLALATTHGAKALALSPSHFTLTPGPMAGLLAIDVSGTGDTDAPLTRVMRSNAPSTLLRWNTGDPCARA